MAFDIEQWRQVLDTYLPGKPVSRIGTRSTDPLVRWSEVAVGPLRFCKKCTGVYTPLGLTRHTLKCRKAR